VEEEDLRDLAPEEAARDALDEREHRLHVAEVVVGQPRGHRLVAAAACVRVGGGVDVFVVVDGDGRDGVGAAGQERLEGAPLVQVEPDVQEGMAEVAQRALLLGQEAARHRLAAHDVLLEPVEGLRVEVAVRVGVVPQLVTVRDPRAQDVDPLLGDGGRLALDEELALVDEPDHRHLGVAEGGQQLARVLP